VVDARTENESRDNGRFSKYRVKIKDWDQRYNSVSRLHGEYDSQLNELHEVVNKQQNETLHMDTIRKIIDEKESNLDGYNRSIKDIERLINELKIAELELVKSEEQEKIKKALLEEISQEIPKVLDKFDKFMIGCGALMIDLQKIYDTLMLMKDHPDYLNDQEMVENHLQLVSTKIADLKDTYKSLETTHEFIENLLAEQQNLEMNSYVNLEKTLNEINKIMNKFGEDLSIPGSILAIYSDVSPLMGSVFELKKTQYVTFKESFADMKGQMGTMLERFDQLKQRDDLNNENLEKLEEVGQLLDENQNKIDELHRKSKTHKDLIKQVSEQFDLPRKNNYSIL
jgi:hypothetical protein